MTVLGQGMSSLDREWADAARTGDGGPDKVHTAAKQFKNYVESACTVDVLSTWWTLLLSDGAEPQQRRRLGEMADQVARE